MGNQVHRLNSLGTMQQQAVDSRHAKAIKSYRRALRPGMLWIEGTVTRAGQAKCWDLILMDSMMQDMYEQTRCSRS
jgi:hypothetical protein